ncbi:hypothetical protein ACET3Z_019399 [Daucus carota]
MEGLTHSHTNSQVSQAKLHSFHTIDRMLYAILVADLLCDPTDAMQIMAFWLWLEQAGFRNVVKRISHLPLMLIDDLVHEANICLNFIKNSQALNEIGDIHLRLRLIKDFSLENLHKNQTLAQSGVKIVCTNICLQAFSDLTQNALLQNEVRKREPRANSKSLGIKHCCLMALAMGWYRLIRGQCLSHFPKAIP